MRVNKNLLQKFQNLNFFKTLVYYFVSINYRQKSIIPSYFFLLFQSLFPFFLFFPISGVLSLSFFFPLRACLRVAHSGPILGTLGIVMKKDE